MSLHTTREEGEAERHQVDAGNADQDSATSQHVVLREKGRRALARAKAAVYIGNEVKQFRTQLACNLVMSAGIAMQELKDMSLVHREVLFEEHGVKAVHRHRINTVLADINETDITELDAQIVDNNEQHDMERSADMVAPHVISAGGQMVRNWKVHHVLGDATKVYSHVHLNDLFSLDTKEQTFHISFSLYQLWKVAEMPEDLDFDLMHIVRGLGDTRDEWMPNWCPLYSLDDSLEVETVCQNSFTIFSGTEPCGSMKEWRAAIENGSVSEQHFWVVLETEHKATISDPLDLTRFPLDSQDVTLTIFLEDESERTQMVPIEKAPRDVVEQALPMAYNKAVSVDYKGLDTPDFFYDRATPYAYKLFHTFEEEGEHHSAIMIHLFVSRQIQHYAGNVLLMVFSITSITAVVWALPVSELADRLSIDFVNLLVSQAFKQIISEHLPPVNYLTHLDICECI